MAAPWLLATTLVLAAGRAHATALPTGFTDQAVLRNLNEPIALAFLPDGRLFFIEYHDAEVRLIVNGRLASLDPAGVIDQVRTDAWERGLLGIAVDPGFPARPYVYVQCCDALHATQRISRYTLTGDLGFSGDGHLQLVSGSRYDLVNTMPDVNPEHKAGTLRFGPDGCLYSSLGDDLVPCDAQSPTSLRGAILRLDVSRLPGGAGGPPDPSLITPPDNPFVGNSDWRARLVWAFGLRNPFKFHIDPATGNLFVADVGDVTCDEVDVIAAPGHDLGWPMLEGPAPWQPSCSNNTSDAPVYAYDHVNQAAALMSAGVYRHRQGNSAPFPTEYDGDYFFSDFYAGFLRRLKWNGSGWAIAPPVAGQPDGTNWGTGFQNILEYAEAPDGSLWYVQFEIPNQSYSGEIHRIAYTGTVAVPAAPPPTQPAAVQLAPPSPTPARGRVTLRYELPVETPVRLGVFALDGARVRPLRDGAPESPGAHEVVWDGRDASGAAVPPGLYFAVLEADGMVERRRIVMVR